MRYLTIVRHAKASPAVAGEVDFERTLNRRGREQCAQLREWASDQKALGSFGPTTALVSAAARTKETYELSFEGTSFVSHVEFSELIYNGHRDVSTEDVLTNLGAIDPLTTSLMVVGHNPTVLYLMHALAKSLPTSMRGERYPLGGAFVLELPKDRSVALEHFEVVASFVPD